MTGPIFDTHAHYSSRAFDADRFALLDSLPEKGVVGVCEQATHSGDAPRVLELAHRYPWVYAAIGGGSDTYNREYSLADKSEAKRS